MELHAGFFLDHVHCDKALMGGGEGLMRGDKDLMGGPNFDSLYHKLKVLLLSLILLY